MQNAAGKLTVLFLCTGNSCRSQMAEGLLRVLGGRNFDVYSAGVEPAQSVNPHAARVMEEIGIPIAHQTTNDLEDYLGRITAHYVVILCDSASKKCPRLWPGALNRLEWPFEDPAEHEGGEEEKLEKYREIRDGIKSKIEEWLDSEDGPRRILKASAFRF